MTVLKCYLSCHSIGVFNAGSHHVAVDLLNVELQLLAPGLQLVVDVDDVVLLQTPENNRKSLQWDLSNSLFNLFIIRLPPEFLFLL